MGNIHNALYILTFLKLVPGNLDSSNRCGKGEIHLEPCINLENNIIKCGAMYGPPSRPYISPGLKGSQRKRKIPFESNKEK